MLEGFKGSRRESVIESIASALCIRCSTIQYGYFPLGLSAANHSFVDLGDRVRDSTGGYCLFRSEADWFRIELAFELGRCGELLTRGL